MFYVTFFCFCWCFHLIIMFVHCFVHCRLAFKSKVLKFKKFCFMLLEHAKICLCDTYHFKIGCKNWTNVFNAVLWKKICRKIVVIIDLFLHFSARIIFCCRSKQVSHFMYVNWKRLNKIKQNGIKFIFLKTACSLTWQVCDNLSNWVYNILTGLHLLQFVTKIQAGQEYNLEDNFNLVIIYCLKSYNNK
jgi:hypothetical protein